MLGGGRIWAARLTLSVALLLGASATVSAAMLPPVPPVPPLPIPALSPPTQPFYEGAPAHARPILGTGRVPHNPFMAANGRSLIHDDGWQTDTFTWGGPLGRAPQQLSSEINRDCGSITLDRQGRVVSVCVGASGPQLYMFDPSTLATLATFSLPARNYVPSNVFQDYTGGGYFYLDNRDRVITATTTKHIYVIGETPGSPGFALLRDYDLSQLLTSNERINSALPDSRGLLWIVAREDGVVLTLNLATGATHLVRLGRGTVGEIENSFATDQHGGVYIATNRRLYRFVAGQPNDSGAARSGEAGRRARGELAGAPKITWQITYPNSFQHKPGQVDDGTGTTPTVMPGGYVNITDNADPMDVIVYRTAVHPTRLIRRRGHVRRVRAPRQVCRVPVFARGSSDDENSLISAGRSMIAENNYGYNTPADVSGGKLTAPGFARVDLSPGGTGCRLVWTNTTERAPTVVSKLSLATGLIYTYTKDPGGSDPWYWTAIDFRTGRTVYKVLSGTGSLGYNNNYAGLTFSPSGSEYLGTLGGIIALRDGG